MQHLHQGGSQPLALCKKKQESGVEQQQEHVLGLLCIAKQMFFRHALALQSQCIFAAFLAPAGRAVRDKAEWMFAVARCHVSGFTWAEEASARSKRAIIATGPVTSMIGFIHIAGGARRRVGLQTSMVIVCCGRLK